ncbi:hypothetical protein M0804_001139 [Polistes exclamans]|nr:hypothetical protein M0804_001139 [Polistes exclamans]
MRDSRSVLLLSTELSRRWEHVQQGRTVTSPFSHHTTGITSITSSSTPAHTRGSPVTTGSWAYARGALHFTFHADRKKPHPSLERQR